MSINCVSKYIATFAQNKGNGDKTRMKAGNLGWKVDCPCDPAGASWMGD